MSEERERDNSLFLLDLVSAANANDSRRYLSKTVECLTLTKNILDACHSCHFFIESKEEEKHLMGKSNSDKPIHTNTLEDLMGPITTDDEAKAVCSDCKSPPPPSLSRLKTQ